MSEDQTTEENVSRETTVGQQIETNNTLQPLQLPYK